MCGMWRRTTRCCGFSRREIQHSGVHEYQLHVAGGYEVYERFQEELGVGHKGVTPDGLFSLEEVECIGLLLGAGDPGELRVCDEIKPDSVPGSLTASRAARGSNGATNARLVSHPDEVKIVTRRFGQGAANIDRISNWAATNLRKAWKRDRVDHRRDEGLEPARTGRRGVPGGNEVVVRAKQSAKPKYVLVNGDESDRGM